MRDVHHGQRQALLQIADFVAHLAAQARVEIGKRFVEEQHRGLEHQRARDRHTLLLSTRQLRRQATVEPGQAHGGKRGSGAFIRLRFGNAGDNESIAHIFQNGHVRKQRVALEHH